MTRSHDSKAFERAKRQQRLRCLTGQAIGDYRMIEVAFLQAVIRKISF
jgi:hypothetical protein